MKVLEKMGRDPKGAKRNCKFNACCRCYYESCFEMVQRKIEVDEDLLLQTR